MLILLFRRKTVNTKKITITGLLTALAIIIPQLPLKIVLPPASFTLASHVPLAIAMFISPISAAFVAIGSTIGFFMSFPTFVAARAATHLLWAVPGSYVLMYILKKNNIFTGKRNDWDNNSDNNTENKISKSFYLTLAATAILIISLFANWLTTPFKNDQAAEIKGFNLITLFTKMNSYLESLHIDSSTFVNYKLLSISFLVLIIIAIILLIASLILYKNKIKAILAYTGFGIFTAVSAAFMIFTFYFNSAVSEATSKEIKSAISFTALPFLILVLSIIALVICVKRPGINKNNVFGYVYFWLTITVLSILHGIFEFLVILIFFPNMINSYDSILLFILLIGAGTGIHGMIDFIISIPIYTAVRRFIK